MPQQFFYKEALKLGLKEVRIRTSKGLNPYLPALDDIVSPKRALNGIRLGIVQIPVWFIVGTKTESRTNSFAANFMPVLEENTEFSNKWEALYRSNLTEGIREPVKVYEYLNRYYVEEGNKRVSVLKFCGSYSVQAEVIRIMPEKKDTKEVKLYLEYLEFNKYSKINFIEFSKSGSYRELLRLMGKKTDDYWTEEERRRFSSTYYFFEKAYYENGGNEHKHTVGDAMLSYIQVYGFTELQHANETKIGINLKKMWEEISLKEKDDAIELKESPTEGKKPSVRAMVLNIAKPTKLKAAFIYDMPYEKSSWVNEHEMGRRHAQTVLSDKVETSYYECLEYSDIEKTLKRAISDGNKIIFTISPRMLNASLRAAIDHPEIAIMNCSLNISHRYVRTYYPRMYEVKFILGVLAGSLTKSGRLGYVCDYPIFGQIAGINAFALGAQMANPGAKVFLEWSSVKGAKDAAISLSSQNIHLISSQDTARYSKDERKSFGLSHIENEKSELLAVPVWKWGVYYERILRAALDETIKIEYVNTTRALNYYWGMSAGVVDLEYAPALPQASRRFADFFRNSIISGAGKPFLTPFATQNGDIIGAGQRELSLEQIINMDYLVDNIVGTIPAYDELSDIGKSTVDTVGIHQARFGSSKKGGALL